MCYNIVSTSRFVFLTMRHVRVVQWKESACNAVDMGSIPGSERSSGKGNVNPLQYSCQSRKLEMQPEMESEGISMMMKATSG